MKSMGDVRERIARREQEVQKFSRDATRHGKEYEFMAWDADYYDWPKSTRATVDKMAEDIRDMWESIAIIAGKLAADREALRKAEHPTVWEIIKAWIT